MVSCSPFSKHNEIMTELNLDLCHEVLTLKCNSVKIRQNFLQLLWRWHVQIVAWESTGFLLIQLQSVSIVWYPALHDLNHSSSPHLNCHSSLYLPHNFSLFNLYLSLMHFLFQNIKMLRSKINQLLTLHFSATFKNVETKTNLYSPIPPDLFLKSVRKETKCNFQCRWRGCLLPSMLNSQTVNVRFV